MPRTLYIQADNASDNKNFAMIGFLAALVQHDYCYEVQLSFSCSLDTLTRISTNSSVCSRDTWSDSRWSRPRRRSRSRSRRLLLASGE